jgi:predicted PolB exonuclease-like 3'-5' exonuclease
MVAPWVAARFGPQLRACSSFSGLISSDGMSGGEVEKYYGEGRIREIADYCESDVVNTYRVWLRYELFRGHLIRCRISGERGEPH